MEIKYDFDFHNKLMKQRERFLSGAITVSLGEMLGEMSSRINKDLEECFSKPPEKNKNDWRTT